MGKFEKFKVSDDLTPEQEAYIAECAALTPNTKIEKSTDIYVRNLISRFGWTRSKIRTDSLKAARKTRGQYECACCKGLFKGNEVEVDHKVSRVPRDGNCTLTEYIARTFCALDQLAVLCVGCHRKKSLYERYR